MSSTGSIKKIVIVIILIGILSCGDYNVQFDDGLTLLNNF